MRYTKKNGTTTITGADGKISGNIGNGALEGPTPAAMVPPPPLASADRAMNRINEILDPADGGGNHPEMLERISRIVESWKEDEEEAFQELDNLQQYAPHRR